MGLRFFNRVRFKIALMAGALLVGLSLAALAVLTRTIATQGTEAIKQELANTHKVFAGLLEEKRQSLKAQAFVLADSTQFKTLLNDKRADPGTVADTAQGRKNELGLGLFQVANRRGALLANLVGETQVAVPKPAKDAKPEDGVFKKAVDPEEPSDAFGAWAGPAALYETYTRPVIVADKTGGEVLGGIRVGFAMDEAFARSLRDFTGSEVALLAGGKVMASSLPTAPAAQLQAELAAMQGASDGGVFNATLGGVSYLGQFQALAGPDGKTAAQLLELRSRENVLALLKRIRQTFIAILGGGLFVALLLSIVFSRGITKPLDSLIAGTRAVEKGDLDFRIEVESKDELGELAESFNEMIGDLKEKERVKALFGRFLPKAVADRALEHQGEIQLGGEEKDVAILFSDIRGFTSLSERLSPPEVVAMLNDYYTRMIDVLFDNDGTLDKTIGDAIMAVFGAPVSDPDSAGKALRTALGMMEVLKGFNAERQAAGKEPIHIGIGVNTGVVVAGNLGSVKQLSYTVIGDEVNLASRMCSNAKAGQILVTEAVYRKTKWQFQFNSLEPIKVKNVTNPVQVYEVLGVRAQG